MLRILARALAALSLLAWAAHLWLWLSARDGTCYGYGWHRGSVDAFVFPQVLLLQYNAGYFPGPDGLEVVTQIGAGPVDDPFDLEVRDDRGTAPGTLYRLCLPQWFASAVLALPWLTWLGLRWRRRRRDRARGFDVVPPAAGA